MDDKYTKLKASIPTITGRLLYELSWEGNAKDTCREGGRGRENLLTAEVLQILDFLPREEFLGRVVDAMHGADCARKKLISEIESADLQVLPPEIHLAPSATTKKGKGIVQPDGHLSTESVYCFVEAKRIRSSSFQPHQLAREVVAATQQARDRTPLLMLLLGKEPPVRVRKHGVLSIKDAVDLSLAHVVENEAENFRLSTEQVQDRLPETVCWITWQEVGEVVAEQARTFMGRPDSVNRAVMRMAKTLAMVLDWHS